LHLDATSCYILPTK